jgi:hypothetical protein
LSNCVIVRQGRFQVIQPKKNEIIKLCPVNVSGYISKLEGESEFNMQVDNERIPHIIADGILSKIISKKGNVYKVVNHGESTESYLIELDGIFSHGKTLKEAKESLLYKFKDIDKSEYEFLTLDSELSFKDCLKMYRAITGACHSGIGYFCKRNNFDTTKTYKVSEVIEFTEGQYNHNLLVDFFKNK